MAVKCIVMPYHAHADAELSIIELERALHSNYLELHLHIAGLLLLFRFEHALYMHLLTWHWHYQL